MSRLDELRSRIRRLDEAIVELVALRTEVAREIGREKKQAGIPLRDWNVERQVLERAGRLAEELRLPPEAVRSLMQVLIATSRAEQERVAWSSYSGDAADIVIIGGAGKMGRWFVDFFGNQGHRVRICDPAQREPGSAGTLAQATAGADFALVATPLASVPKVIEQLVEGGFDGTIFDVASLKSHLRPAVERARAAGAGITSIHPMFGPSTRTLSDKVICVCDCGDPQATARVEAFFADTAATLVRLGFDQHDRIISYVLGLSHLINLLFAKVLMASGLSYDEIQRVGSTTFHSQMETTATVIRENPDLYYAIQRINPFSAELREAVSRELAELSDWISNDQRQDFVRMMHAARQWMNEQ